MSEDALPDYFIHLPPRTEAKPSPTKAAPAKAEPSAMQAFIDRLSTSGRPSDRLVKSVLKPEGAGEHVARAVATAPLFAAGWPLALGSAAGLGAMDSAARGGSMSDMGWRAAVDTAITAATRGVLGSAGKALGKTAEKLDPLAKVKGKLQGGADADVDLKHLDRLVDHIKSATGPAARAKAIDYGANELNKLYAGLGDKFRAILRTSSSVPSPLWEAARLAQQGVQSPAARGLAGAEAIDPYGKPGIPAGAGAAMAAGQHLPGIAGKAVGTAARLAE